MLRLLCTVLVTPADGKRNLADIKADLWLLSLLGWHTVGSVLLNTLTHIQGGEICRRLEHNGTEGC